MKNFLNKILCRSRVEQQRNPVLGGESGNLYRFQIKFGMTKFILILIIFLASFFRLFGLDWDQGQHLHPDERFLTMVVSAMKIPSTFLDYLNPKISTMNPYNLNFSFFVYGTFPLFLTRIVGELVNKVDYWNVHFVGRVLSAIFDVGVVILLFKIGKKIFNEKIGLLSAFLYSIMVLPIQLSHFFAVDTFLNFFIVLSFYFIVLLIYQYPNILISSLLGLSFGLAMACKISALYFGPIIALGYLFLLLKNLKSLKFLKVLISGIIFLFVSIFVFRLTQPSAFSSGNFSNWQPNPQLIKNINELKSYNNSDSWFPPAIQWHSAKPIIFPLKNMILWGLGLPLGIIALISLISSLIFLKKKNIFIFLIVLWAIGSFTYLGIQFCKTMRYFLPIYPFLAILSAKFLADASNFLKEKFPKLLSPITYTLYAILLVYPVSFLSIYSHPITRVSASEWIYKNIPTNSTVTFEEWDDGIPLGLPNYPPVNFKSESLFMYDFDTPEKWQKLNEKLAKVDYIFLTSNRAYGSTMKLPDKYPQTIKYYQDLFNGTGQFKKVAEFTSRPCFPPIGKPLFCFNDDNAEEAFTVYDHPKVIIFQRDKKADPREDF